MIDSSDRALLPQPEAAVVARWFIKSPAPVGERFGLLTVTGEGMRHRPDAKGQWHRTWVCRCDCGNVCAPMMSNIKAGRSKSCGCQEAGKHPASRERMKVQWAETKRMWAEQAEIELTQRSTKDKRAK